jgi:nitrate reductase (cytochrome)
MTRDRLTRRDVLKLEAAAMAAAAGGLPSPLAAANLITERSATELAWNKAPCRFCGTGCSVMVATKDDRVVATHGDIKAEVNRGLNCVKAYFLSKIMYGTDRLTRPLLRKRNGAFDKDGDFTPVGWDEAFDVMAEKFKDALKKRGPSGVGMFGSGQWTMRSRSTCAAATRSRCSRGAASSAPAWRRADATSRRAASCSCRGSTRRSSSTR